MKRLRLSALIAMLLLLLGPAPSAVPQPSTLVVLHFNDDYQLSAVENGKLGGLDRLAGAVRRFRASERCTLLLFAGDLISPSVESSVFKGAQLIDGLNLLGVDAATLGNHEFDYGPAELQRRIGESKFPWVISNVFVAGARPFPGTRLYLIRNVCGVNVGIFGLLTPETETSSSPGATWFGDPIASARAVVSVIRRAGAERIIALTHLRVEDDERLLAAVPEVDLVIGGHEHDPLTRTVGGRLIAKAGSDAKWLGVTRVPLRGAPRAAHELVTIDEKTPADPAMAALLRRYADQLARDLEVVIGETTTPLDARNQTVRQQESALGNYIADVMRAAVAADVAITNGGGIRTNALFPPGPIRRRDVFAWLPFGNVIVKVAVRGTAIRSALENGVSQWQQVGGRFPQVSGLTYSFNPDRTVGSRLLEIRVGGRPLDDAATYTVATNDFMLRGGDGYAMLASGEVLVGPSGGPLMVTAVIEAIQRARTISPRPEGRITISR
ncbi:MAG: 5'-nucleotidase C-terminal domain-containing protein [Armatimonadota bacterium]|nr:5'-nucleotidase C-terminal domain-containing protein [Armatimonadota bacterium]MDR7451709.1 5'-nucleotidase C-terminal domain-containing protein [Armatimonadota bacterium]MDR7465673.1 5'-nucleotidase C-terminal domain-containing protein [Armatimonadota bacterium]MDR7493582.1 5'-nucleotidase C-terminal domain-containing protein [Armatimonadota bacterium]MDR7499514.1 5'-nucleotidase C-terminal domain-containing protein [Armatimonadota bacterium]